MRSGLTPIRCTTGSPTFCLLVSLIPVAKETGKFEKELRYPGEDDVYENPKMDALRL